MGARYWLTFGVIGLVWVTQTQAEVYRWKDASGRTIYGDNPPEEFKNPPPLELPSLTISDGYQQKAEAAKAKTESTAKPQDKKEFKYDSFTVVAPKKDEGIRANEGNVTIELAIEPSLQAGHQLILYVDGKQVGQGGALTYNLQNLERGTHTTFGVIQDDKDNIIMNTEVTTFHIFRAKKKRNLKDTDETENSTDNTPAESQSGNTNNTRII